MADDKTFTQADIDKAIAAAVAKVQESVDRLESKNEELIAENRKAKAAARAASEIKPEDLTAAEERAEKAEAALTQAQKDLKAITVERDKAVKGLETEQGAARSYALEAEINAAIAAGNIVPALVPAFTAMLKQNAKAELVDGKYAVKIGEKAAKEHVTEFLATEEGKAFKAATVNGGGGAPGSDGSGSGGKQVSRSAFDAMDQGARATFAKEGGKVVDA